MTKAKREALNLATSQTYLPDICISLKISLFLSNQIPHSPMERILFYLYNFFWNSRIFCKIFYSTKKWIVILPIKRKVSLYTIDKSIGLYRINLRELSLMKLIFPSYFLCYCHHLWRKVARITTRLHTCQGI